MNVEYISHMGSDLSPVNAARVSFDKVSDWEIVQEPDVLAKDMAGNPFMVEVKRLSDKDKKLIHYLAKNKHTSCFEHQTLTLRLKVPIFIARQIQRHRTFAYNEISRRYVDNPPEFFWPDTWRGRAENVKQGSAEEPIYDAVVDIGGDKHHTTPQDLADSALRHAVFCYETMLKNNIAPELARMVLPQNMYTEFYMTGNLRNWAHFLKLRLDPHAQLEVQQIANKIADVCHIHFPVSTEALLAYN